jgi:hypothetical protein
VRPQIKKDLAGCIGALLSSWVVILLGTLFNVRRVLFHHSNVIDQSASTNKPLEIRVARNRNALLLKIIEYPVLHIRASGENLKLHKRAFVLATQSHNKEL